MEYIMDRNETSRLIEALKQGTVTVTFTKINTDEIRVMPCTLNPVVLEAHGQKIVVEAVSAETDHLAAWSLDKEAWRSFRLSTVTGWEVL
jgi:hypothetical protein|tara:strand:+ start:265 stop:534 length:270 start_codon:yes stop_codon:yes gene_type:complete